MIMCPNFLSDKDIEEDLQKMNEASKQIRRLNYIFVGVLHLINSVELEPDMRCCLQAQLVRLQEIRNGYHNYVDERADRIKNLNKILQSQEATVDENIQSCVFINTEKRAISLV